MATITIVNWESHLPRLDRGTHSWLRLSNTIMFSESLDGLSAEQKWFWVCLLAHASKKHCATFDYNFTYFEKHVGISKKKMVEAIQHLINVGSIMVSDGNQSVASGNQSVASGTATDRQTDRQTDSTNGQKQTEPPADTDLVNLWNENRGPFSEVEKVTEKRKSHIKAQLAKEPDPEHWLRVLAIWKKSDFCLMTWKPNFDDWLNENKRTATIEGKYNNRQNSAAATAGYARSEPRAIRLPTADEVFAEQQAARAAEERDAQPLTAEQREDMQRKLRAITGKIKTI